ncbi:hypothetical protein [Paraflavitalea pollutisoli]|uniref:hypothetical protein n=1 Tax=Paraflavitalea pollutisoli TaxID=3034143 RepID=UPI0023ED0A1D|nr:hypothetical protein [Paraflavitalea sp. H1-2-19X]
MKKNILLWLLTVVMLATSTAYGQTSKLEGLYAGAQIYNTPYNGMQIDNIVLYFRNNGSFTTQLNAPAWKTHVSGQYTIKNGLVQLNFTDGSESQTYKLSANGKLQTTSGVASTLHQMILVTNLPAAGYESRGAATSGGAGTGMPQVGTFSSDFLYFDGKGRFTLDHEGILGIGGDAAGGTIGGKSTSKDALQGTYTLGDGEITLRFNNGKTAKQSFFYSPPTEQNMIVLGGAFYFREDGQAKAGTRQEQTATGTDTKTNSPSTNKTLTAASLVAQLRQRYGGANLDKVNTSRETATITGGFQVVAQADIVNRKLRMEVRQQNKLLLVKQLIGDDGWQWSNGSLQPLSTAEKDELMLSFHQGVMGLHQSLNTALLTGTVSTVKGDQAITCTIKGYQIVYLIGTDLTLKASAYTVGSTPTFNVYRQYAQKDGVSYPTITESSSGDQKLTTTTTAIEFNPVLTEVHWQKP